MADNEDVLFASAYALKALMTVLFAEAPDRQARVLGLLSKMKADTESSELVALVDKAISMVQAAA